MRYPVTLGSAVQLAVTAFVPSAIQLAAVLVKVGTAGVANCSALLNEAEAAEVQPPLLAVTV